MKSYLIILIHVFLLIFIGIASPKNVLGYAANPLGREILADAPWRTQNGLIPVVIVIKDAQSLDTFGTITLDRILIRDMNSGNPIAECNGVSCQSDYTSSKPRNPIPPYQRAVCQPGKGIIKNVISCGYWKKIFVIDIAKLKKMNILRVVNNTVDLSVKINYTTYCCIKKEKCGFLPECKSSFTQYLRVHIGDPLPKFDGWLYGDTHYHSEFTGCIYRNDCTEFTEFGGDLEMTQKTAKSVGLDWVTVTDHAFYLDDACNKDGSINPSSPWTILRTDAIPSLNTTDFKFILGEELAPKQKESESCPTPDWDLKTIHLLAYGTDRTENVSCGGYIFGDEQLNCVDSRSLAKVLSDIKSSSGLAYGAHPLNKSTTSGAGLFHLWDIWIQEDYNMLQVPDFTSSFSGFEFWNTKSTIVKNKPAFTCPPPPFSPDFISSCCPQSESFNGDKCSKLFGTCWDKELLCGIIKWDDLLKQNLNPLRKIFIEGGSDAHGDFNYTGFNIGANNNAFGKVRTLVYAPGGLTEENILNALRDGKSIVTDGPVVIFGIDKNGDGKLDETDMDSDGKPDDVLIGGDTELPLDQYSDFQFLIQWKSNSEFDPINEIHLIKQGSGDAKPSTCTITPLQGEEFEGSRKLNVKKYCFALQQSGQTYYRIETFRLVNEFRAYTNPIWVRYTSPGVNTWAKTYVRADSDIANSIQQTSDGGYIVAGYTFSWGIDADFWILKLDANGDIVWQKTYGGGQYDWANSIQQTSDGGYIVAGETESFGIYGYGVWILKLDANGDIVWQKAYSGYGLQEARSIQQTFDGGYIVTGWNEDRIFILKLDANGDMVWQKTYGGYGRANANSIQQTSDGGYIVAGITVDNFGLGIKPLVWIFKLDASGNIIWEKAYGGGASLSGFGLPSIQKTSDGGYIAAGGTTNFSDVMSDVWVLKLDANGIPIWRKIYDKGGQEAAYSIQQTSDGNYIVAGSWIFEIDTNGNPIWEKNYSRANSIWQTSDGGYIVACENFSVLKLNTNGDIDGSCGSTSNTTVTDANLTPINTSARVDDIGQYVTVTRTTAIPQNSTATITEQCPSQ